MALLSGAGGAALLELVWKPRRDRKKAATLLLAEILINTEVLFLQAHARIKAPRQIPGDFNMSTLAWDTAADSLKELPAQTLKSALMLYNRYRHLNSCVPIFAVALEDIAKHPAGSKERAKAEHYADVTIDVFNTGIDSTIEHAKKLTPDLFKLAGIDPSEPSKADTDFQAKVDKLFAEREERIRRLGGSGGRAS